MADHPHSSSLYAALADAFQYPAPGRVEALEGGLPALPAGAAWAALSRFLGAARALSLGEWEELYTRTWDLDPLTPPYIGFQTWGEDYRRGNFMARLQRACWDEGLSLEGELPDHLIPVLRYLDRAAVPIPELTETLGPAVEKMQATLRKRDPDNPYLLLLKAILEAS